MLQGDGSAGDVGGHFPEPLSLWNGAIMQPAFLAAMILHTVVFTGELKILVGGVTAVGPSHTGGRPPEAAPKQSPTSPAKVHDIYNKLLQLLLHVS